jgi:hypothetical protein
MKRLSLEELKIQNSINKKSGIQNLDAIKGGVVAVMKDCHDQCGYEGKWKIDCN